MSLPGYLQRCVGGQAVLSGLALVVTLVTALAPAHARGFVAHEWGTFTSIAGKDGLAVYWLPLSGPNDLPCFVNHSDDSARFKGGLMGTVRMETPVLYFYTSRELTITVEARFPQGLITEWYPRAELPANANPPGMRDGGIAWRDVIVSPNSAPAFADDGSPSHYYAARAVEATPLRVGKEQERFLFYRGVGQFELPLSARAIEQGEVLVGNHSEEAIGGMVFFEKRGNKLGYRVYPKLQGHQRLTIEPLSLDGDVAGLRHEIEQMLVAQGLYPSEAKAMLETWRDTWFEEGARLLYLVPRRTIDTVLPLSITPKPDQTTRVFVGRLEVITPATMDAVAQAIADHDSATFRRYGRFATPIVQRISAERGHVFNEDLSRVWGNRAAPSAVQGCPTN